MFPAAAQAAALHHHQHVNKLLTSP